ncbi:tRNA (N6-isopentenyl adenosine(37)-C2)-methylthiotransferase MiaB [Chryseotalea sanaruensis]|uniref:tRNA-2-methylthio-N(6)-dimethylallyladenosine synthase n=1 Tax=Chryseotalea sanaruensis TaxID=2482724 RepID=A0A401U4X6_9BACT|nr:tRNA (N6-isopentenyl adenosine(37)-C2)-methylthiotransferase MiaB [Chryseotalea sanaruensis]GCC49967.1 tRNA (N6-isopentenyl adenosine(37)-C2)-methylthiotransferase MiaB [Chryseotalea sanaruensis]
MENLVTNLDILDKNSEEACETVKTTPDQNTGKGRKLYIESYGCQMNFSDSEIVASILHNEGFDTTSEIEKADLIFLNTCSIREKAEQTVRHRLMHIHGLKKHKPELLVGVLGCMAERLKSKFLEEEKIVDLVAGPDAYRDLPKLIGQVDEGQKAINTFLSRDETYADISPVRLNSNGVTAFVSIMRGCDNMCTFCVVPFTRGRERSRNPQSIVAEAQDLFDKGFKEVTLLGQNVDSYKWSPEENNKMWLEKKGISNTVTFAMLLEMVAQISPSLRVRFSTSHPKDITDDVLYTIAKYENICKYVHLPIQSGSSRILEMMNRGYTREWYLGKIQRIKEILGDDCGISSDMIIGFCTETEEEHQETLSLMDIVQFDFAYMFYYSERPGTLAEKKYKDDIDLPTKTRRLDEVIKKQRAHALQSNLKDVGKVYTVLIEGFSKRSTNDLQGRTTTNKVIVFPKGNHEKGEYVDVFVKECTGGTLIGEVVNKAVNN